MPAPAVYAAPSPVMVYTALTQAVSYAAQAQVLEHFAPASSAYAERFANSNREFHSLPVVPTVYTCICGGVQHAGTSSLCCTFACHGVHCADTSSVLRSASTSTGVLRACVFSKCRTFCKLQQRVSFSPCRAHRLHLHSCGVHRAGTSSLCCTCACHGVHRAPRKSIPSVVSSNRSFRPRNSVKVTLLRPLQTQFLCRTIVWSIWTHVSCSAQTSSCG